MPENKTITICHPTVSKRTKRVTESNAARYLKAGWKKVDESTATKTLSGSTKEETA